MPGGQGPQQGPAGGWIPGTLSRQLVLSTQGSELHPILNSRGTDQWAESPEARCFLPVLYPPLIFQDVFVYCGIIFIR